MRTSENLPAEVGQIIKENWGKRNLGSIATLLNKAGLRTARNNKWTGSAVRHYGVKYLSLKAVGAFDGLPRKRRTKKGSKK